MARKSLRPQLNQIRAWVRQGRTDAWIAHQLDIPASELREFRRRHDLAPGEESEDLELRDEIEAEIEALSDAEEVEEEDEAEEAEDAEEAEEPADEEEPAEEQAASGAEAAGRERARDGGPRRRRRRRRGGRRAGAGMQATFDHGAEEGYGLWLDPAVKDDPVYTEHWAGHRQVEVTIEPDRIVIRRA